MLRTDPDKNRAVFASWAVLGICFFAAYYPIWTGLIRVWSNSDDYSHGFLIVPLAGYIAWQRFQAFYGNTSSGPIWALGLAILTLLLYIFAMLGEIVTLASISLVLFIACAILYLYGWPTLKNYLFPLFLLFFMIPVPAQIYAALTIPLQLIVTKSTAFVASLAGIPVFREGNVIHLPDRTFEVVQACSGLRSIMSLLALGAVFGYFTLESNIRRAILFLSAVPIAILVNIFRVLVLVTVAHYLNIDLTQGTSHTVLGLLVFVVAFGLFLLFQKGLSLWGTKD